MCLNIFNRPAVNLNLESSQCPHPSLMMKTWSGLTPGLPQLGIVFLKVLNFLICIYKHHCAGTKVNTTLLTGDTVS